MINTMTKKPYFAPEAELLELNPYAVYCTSNFGAGGEDRDPWNTGD